MQNSLLRAARMSDLDDIRTLVRGYHAMHQVMIDVLRPDGISEHEGCNRLFAVLDGQHQLAALQRLEESLCADASRSTVTPPST